MIVRSLKFLLLSLAVVLLLHGVARAQGIVRQVQIQGAEVLDESLVQEKIYLKPGDAFDRVRVSEDVVRLYQLGFFEDVIVEKIPTAGGVKVIYRVVLKPPIDKIIIEGEDKIGEDKIRAKITVKVNAPPDNKKIAESKEQIKELYLNEGRSGAIVDTELRQMDGQQQLVFKINESANMVVRQVDFQGNTVFSEGKLRRLLKTKKKGFLSFLTSSGKYREDIIERDVAFLTYTYLNEGYLQVRVGQPSVEFSAEQKGLILTFPIDEGKQYRIGEITVDGDILTTKEQLLSMVKIKSGDLFSQKIIQDDVTRMSDLYGNQGYAFANINPQTHINEDVQTVDINFQVDEGQKAFIERINIVGNTVTRDKVIRRELKVVENSLYNESLIDLSKKKLEQLGYFENVEISTPRGSADDKLSLNIKVKEKSTGTFSVGAGYSSVDSFLFTASVSKNNFMGLGVSGSLSAELSRRRQQFSFNYADPHFLDSNWLLSVSGFRISALFDDFRRQSFGGQVDLGRHLFDFSSISVGYRIEDVQVNDFNAIVPEFFRQNDKGLTSSLVFQATRDTRNNPILTTKGTYNNFVLEYAGNGLGGNDDFMRYTGNARFFLPGWSSSVLKGNARIGYIKSLNNSSVPLFERFFTGGINSLRGYQLRSVGPRITIPDSITGVNQDFVYGGNKLLVFNLEYEFPLYEAAGFRGVIFADAGNAYAENESFDIRSIRTDAGAGVRWLSPFGPLRFEWGFPFAKRPGDQSVVFNFTIGSFF